MIKVIKALMTLSSMIVSLIVRPKVIFGLQILETNIQMLQIKRNAFIKHFRRLELQTRTNNFSRVIRMNSLMII